MNSFDQAYTITTNGSWPDESYSITINQQLISPSNFSLPANNQFRFVRSPFTKMNNLANYSYANATYTTSDDGLETISTASNTVLTWNTNLERRTYDLGPTFNFFDININPGNELVNDQSFYCYILFPSRLFLYPTGAPTYSGSGWTLNTNTVVLSPTSFYLFSDDSAAVSMFYDQYVSSKPAYTSITPNANYSIVYSLCSIRHRTYVPLIPYSTTHNPYFFSKVLEPSQTGFPTCTIRADSTVVYYDVNFYAPLGGSSYSLNNLGQYGYDYPNLNGSTLYSSYIVNFDNIGQGLQRFQLLQIKTDNTGDYLSSTKYCVLSSVFNLNNTNFMHYSKFYAVNKLSFVNTTTGIPGTVFGVDYTADSPVFQLSRETVQSTLNGFTVNSVSTSISNTFLTTSTGFGTVSWTTKYPPHYYGYKARIKSSADGLSETACLNFYIYASAVKTTTNTVTLSTIATSDFGIVNYDISSRRDFIKFTPINTVNEILSSITCSYGTGFATSYSLLNPTWVPISAAKDLLITYPTNIHGEINLSIRPTLSCLGGIIDADRATPIQFSKGVPPDSTGDPIFISKVYETEDYLQVDSSFLDTDDSWPTRDLTNSYISWFTSPTGSNGYPITINAVDLSGNYIQTIPQLSSVVFDDSTCTIVVSGYGPVSTTIYLSSRKYDEVTSLTSNSALFNYFKEGSLLVGFSKTFNNLNKVRTASLTAAVPYNGKTYYLPTNMLMNWTWTYDGNNEYLEIPVSAYNLGDVYSYGDSMDTTTLSSIYFEIEPPYSEESPTTHNISINASVDTIYGLVEGELSFEVDDFPDPSIFNTDFLINYQGYTKYSDVVLNTGDGKYVLTRPHDGTNNFSISAINSTVTTGTLTWGVSSNYGYSTTSSGSSPLLYAPNLVSKSIISLSANNVVAGGWLSAHSVKTEATIYVLNAAEFATPLSFINFPEYFWINGRKLTISTPNNYTLATAPTAYANKISNSQGFLLSASKSYFNQYNYYIGNTTKEGVSGITQYYQYADIPYQTDMFAASGATLYLEAYNDTFYPEYNGVSYRAPIAGSLRTLAFNITATTYSPTTAPSAFRANPRIVPYTKSVVSFSPSITSINLDTQRIISITQTVTTNPIETAPQPIGGTITYTLSSPHWKVNTDIPASNGTYNVFQLMVGDSVTPLTVSGTAKNNLVLSASASIEMKIQPSTFSNYGQVAEFSGNLWNSEIQQLDSTGDVYPIVASSPTATPKPFLSTTYTLTSNPIFVQFESPYYSDRLGIIAYIVDFGEDNSTQIIEYDEAAFYQYSNKGTYYISYTAVFNDGSMEYYEHLDPIVVYTSWQTYDPTSLRFVDETALTLPYSEDDISIQPNEWGDADIFNTAVTRIQGNLDYLKAKTQTLNTYSPTVFFGWFGCNSSRRANGIRWYTKDNYPSFYNLPNLATSSGTSYFTQIKDVCESNDYMFVLEGTMVRAFSAGYIGSEIYMEGMDDLSKQFINPLCMDINEAGTSLFIVDPPKNKIYRCDVEMYGVTPTINYSLNTGSLGSAKDTNKFNSPSEIVYASNSLFVLDYNNKCIKEFNSDLNWLFTYKSTIFETERPIGIAAHPQFKFLYVLTNKYNVYVFDNQSNDYFASFSVAESNDKTKFIKMILDENGDFIYLVKNKSVYKYFSNGYYITKLELPTSVSYVGAKKGFNRSINLISSRCVSKIQDILEVFSIGGGVASQYWSSEQISIGKNEFASDINYNRCLIRMAQNIKTFRDSLVGKFVLANEQTSSGTITYFSLVPTLYSEKPSFDFNIENEQIGVGVNELHVPQVLNKELVTLYNATVSLLYFLNIDNYNIQTGNSCESGFCWSWKATSCYNLTLPIIRICNVNPITYSELKTNTVLSYAPTKTWGAATSDCCNNSLPPV